MPYAAGKWIAETRAAREARHGAMRRAAAARKLQLAPLQARDLAPRAEGYRRTPVGECFGVSPLRPPESTGALPAALEIQRDAPLTQVEGSVPLRPAEAVAPPTLPTPAHVERFDWFASRADLSMRRGEVCQHGRVVNTRRGGVAFKSRCPACDREFTPSRVERSAAWRAGPCAVSWADPRGMRPFYERAAQLTRETGVAHEVDHVIPLRGVDAEGRHVVSGLHVAENLQVLTEVANREKRNRFNP